MDFSSILIEIKPVILIQIDSQQSSLEVSFKLQCLSISLWNPIRKKDAARRGKTPCETWHIVFEVLAYLCGQNLFTLEKVTTVEAVEHTFNYRRR